MFDQETLVALTLQQATRQPDQLAYRFLAKGEIFGESSTCTFGRLELRARAIGAWLQRNGYAGQRALLLYPSGLDFIEAFVGCLFGGVIAVPVFPPRSERTLPRLAAVVGNAQPSLILATTAIMNSTRGMSGGATELNTLPWQVSSEIPDDLAQHWSDPGVTAGSIAFLQYTSGSTSTPKGVMVSHGNLLANQLAAERAMRVTPEVLDSWPGDLACSWLPLQHDMGLLGPVVGTLCRGRTATLMSPLHFLQKPVRWLQAISHFGAHTSGAPNFAYDLCVSKAQQNPQMLAGLDLSRWTTAFNGAEPVRWETLRRFAETFAPCGFRAEAFVPCYGMAETTLIVAGHRSRPAPHVLHADPDALLRGRAEPNPNGRALVSCGGATEVVKVVDTERQVECAEGEVGEVWIHGPSVAHGYWQNAEATEQTFGAKLPGDERRYVRSGDLGFMRGGELFITGRLKDLLIVDGTNHYPQDIEYTVEAAQPAVRQGGVAAFALPTADGDRPAVIAEVKLAKDADPQAIIAAIRAAVSDSHGVSLCTVALVRPQSVLKTSSGKVQRKACSLALQRGELELIARRDFLQIVAEVPPAAEAEQPLAGAAIEQARELLLDSVAARARISRSLVDVDRPLSELGFGSRELVELTGELSESLGRELSPALFYDCPTIGHVLRRLAGESSAPEPLAIDHDPHEPIAIVSMACRFPGDLDTPEALWRALTEGKDVVERFPEGRWDVDALYDPDPDVPGKTYTREGAFLREIDRFDPAFFDIPPREARSMDPQQRLLLEVAWEALERAGVVPASLNESVTGVYVGMFDSGYLAGSSLEQLDGYFGTGSIASAASGRIAYTLGLQGPAVTVDTACSASLVAVHLAAQALRAGECDLALAGGVTLMVTPRLFVEFSRVRGLSPSGRCKSFSDDADGANWGEGCGMLVLKRLRDAERDGDRVLATIRGSAVNQDGRSQGLTAPNGPAQERVIRRALQVAGLAPGDIDYIEAHGTGTTLGDPIEAGALARVFGPNRSSTRPLWLGSLKSNIAHTQAAAGVGGLIKIVLSLQHQQLPKTLHVDKPSRHIDWNGSGLALLTRAQPWLSGERPRRAGVSSFGVSGTNAHVVLEEAPRSALPLLAAREELPLNAGAGLYLLSARSEAALSGQAARLRAYLDQRTEVGLPDVALTLATRRSHFERRAAIVASDRQALLDALASVAAREQAASVVQTAERGLAAGKLVFVFPGQGSQWPDMGRLLIERSPTFARSIERCDAALSPHTGWSVFELLRRGAQPEALERIEIVQPALFSMMVSLAALWRSLGVEPDAVIGHSQGELAAACVAGALSIEHAAQVVARRSKILTRLVGLGASAAVEMPVPELEARLRVGWGDRLAVAAWNGARSAVVSGESRALEELLEQLTQENVFARKLRMTVASHSAQMDPLEREVNAELSGVQGRASAVPMYSTVLAQRIAGDELSTPYWFRNLREPVRFAQTLERLIADGYRAFLEVSPHPLLSLAVESAAEAAQTAVWVGGSLKRDEDADRSIKLALAKLHVAGRTLPLGKLVPPGAHAQDELPTYAFDRQRYWAEADRGAPAVGLSASDHPLLGAGIESPRADRHVFVNTLARGGRGWLSQLSVHGEALVSSMTIVELCRAALQRARPASAWDLTQLELLAPLPLPEQGRCQLQVEVMASESSELTLVLHSRPVGEAGDEAAWTLHATATGVSVEPNAHAAEPLAPSWPADAAELWTPETYPALSALGMQCGDAFRCVSSAAQLGPDAWLVRVALPEALAEADDARYGLHPVLLEAAVQAAAVFDDAGAVLLPASIERCSLASAAVHTLTMQLERRQSAFYDVTLWDEHGIWLGRLRGLSLSPATRASLAPSSSAQRDLFEVSWRPLRPSAPPSQQQSGNWALISEADGGTPVLERLCAAITAAGIRLTRYAPGSDLPDGFDKVLRLWPSSQPLDVPAQTCELTSQGLHEIQATLARTGTAPELVWLTQNALSIPGHAADGGEPARLSQAGLWGLARSARSEYPTLGLRSIDLAASVSDPAQLVAALAHGAEPEIALRAGELLVPRLVRAEVAQQAAGSVSVPADGTLLITGGLGRLGVATARWLASRGAKRLLLVSRTGPRDARSAELIAELSALGAEVQVASCDVADRAALAQLLAQLPAAAPLRGVVHCASVIDDGLLADQSAERFARVMAPKVSGAWNLHELTAGMSLPLFVVYSSAAGVIGAAGRSNGAAAHVFMDQLCCERRARGLAAISLSWGAWSEPGQRPDLERSERQGMGAFTFERGLLLLELSLLHGAPHQVPWALRPARLARSFGADVPAFWQQLVKPQRASAPQRGSLVQALARLPADAQRERVLSMLREDVAQVLGLRAAGGVPADQPMRQLGLDSLMAVELRNRIAARFSCRLSATLLFDHPTLDKLTAYLMQNVLQLTSAQLSLPTARANASADEPIAIVAMACRLPGGVATPEQLWTALEEGRDLVEEFPSDRWDVESLYDPDPEAAGKSYAREGGFIHGIDQFDAGLFEISPREARAMDPQQRLLLETAWEALESAGIVPASLNESVTGVYIGAFDSGYLQGTTLDQMDGYFATGVFPSVASGRLAYTLGLQGPAITLDTACSSSLVAVHLATQALRSGECDLALAGGVSLLLTPHGFVEFSRLRGLSRTGRCRSFSDEADGASWAEGCGLIVLKRQSDAERDGDRVLALIRGSAVNQDGRSQGLTAPNGPAQERVIRQALDVAGVAASEIDYVEAHGTGTTLGDPIEAHALEEVFGRERAAGAPLWLGSLKSNIAHTQAAAGISGLIKVVLSLQHEQLPKTLHADKPTRHVDWDQNGVALVREARAWTRGRRVRRAGVSAFGISGTNAHVVLEEAPQLTAAPASDAWQRLPLAISGRDPQALQAQAGRWVDWLEAHPEVSLGELAYSAALHRTHFEQRAAVQAGSMTEALTALRALRDGAHHPQLVQGRAERGGKVVFVFPGQGSQWPGMGKALLAESPAFERAVRACDAALQPWTGWSVLAVLRGDTGPELPPLDRVDVVQPALFALGVGLAAVWRELGIEPAAVVGHSQGEVPAAVVSGALSLEDGAKIVALRSQAVRKRSGQGGMLLIERPLSEVETFLQPYGDRLSIAAVNTAGSTVVSGEIQALEALRAELEHKALFSRKVNVDYASHSAQMDVLLPDLAAALATVRPRAGAIPLYSTVRCEPLRGEELDATYWCRNLRETVRLDRALEQLLADGHGVFVEVSAHPVLTLTLAGLRETAGAVVVGSLQRERGERRQLYRSLGELHVQGHALPWQQLLQGARGRVLPLPTYAFQRQRYWVEKGQQLTAAGLTASDHPLLGAGVQAARADRWLFVNSLSRHAAKWLPDHALFGEVLLSGTTLLELCHAALRRARPDARLDVSQLELLAPVLLPERGRLQLQVEVVESAPGTLEVAVHTRPENQADAEWTLHATAIGATSEATEAERAPRWPAAAEELWSEDTYEHLERLGLHYGPGFRCVRSVVRLEADAVLARVALPAALTDEASRYGLHPALLDAAQQTALALGEVGDAMMAASFERWSVAHPGASSLLVLARQTARNAEGGRISLTLWDEHGAFIGQLGALHARRVSAADLRKKSQLERDFYEVGWHPLPRVAAEASGESWALINEAASSAEAEQLAAQLMAAGREIVQLAPGASLPTGLHKVLRLWPRTLEGSVPEQLESSCVRALQELQAAVELVGTPQAPSEWVWLTHGAVASAPEEGVPCLSQSGLWGVARSARAEHPALGLRAIDLSDGPLDCALLLAALATPDEPELALRGAQLKASRLLRAEAGQRLALPSAPCFRLDSRERGRIDALELCESDSPLLASGQVRIEVHSAGMNFRDVVYALGVQASELASKAVLETALGSECAGVIVEVAPDVRELAVGQRVMAIAQGSLGSQVVADARVTVAIPDALSFEEAATIPIAFTTAYYGLRELAAVRPGERLLVHAAAGGVGMAALQLARLWKLEVYATASPLKWRVLEELGVPKQRIASSRDLDFAQRFSAGVDVVLNSLAHEYVDASLGLLRAGGRFLEMGKTDVRSAQAVAAAHSGVGYWAYDLLEVGFERVGEMLREIVRHVARGELTPLRRQPFQLEEARTAFRLMAQGGHVGKLVLNVTRPSVPQDGTLLITGGLTGIGFTTASWLAERGAKRLLLISRRGPADPNAQTAITELSALGAEVQLAACDVADRAALAAVLAEIPAHAPLRGVFHSAAVLDDGLLVDQKPERFERVLRPKVLGAWNLHELTEGMPLELFVVYSSAAGVAGSPGQTNYAAANVFLDQLCHERRTRGLPASSIAWGGWSEVGLAVKHVDLARNDARGYVTMTPAHGLALLELALTRRSVPYQLLWILQPARLQKTFGLDVPAMWRTLVQPPRALGEQRSALTESLARLPAAARHERVVELLCDDAASVLGVRSAGQVPADQPLRQLGLDSLMALELRNRISARFQCRLSPSLLFDYPTLEALGRYLLENVLELDNAQQPSAADAPVLAIASDEPIAIISMACRFPAGIDTPEALWHALAQGRDLVEDVPADRWDAAALYDADPDAPGKTYATQGGFVRDVELFDPAFFEITPREARGMDPQQRLLLETAWEALERAGVVPASLNGSVTGVYIGAFDSGYTEGATLEQLDGYCATGATGSVASGRLAYTLGLQGPAITVDTACSSSLVALHLASQALRTGECDMALAGGVTLMLTPRAYVEFSRVRLVSPTSRCKSFSDDADGAGWSDGCGIVLLKRLSDAQRDGDRVLSVIRATAANQDGRSQGLTAPNGPAQERVIKRALALAGVSASDVDYVEAHGTGTTLGDPIEANALAHVYGRARAQGQPLWLGSLKSNIAHAQAAGGIGGVIKVVLSLLNEQLPKTLYSEKPTQHVDWENSGLALVTEQRPWQRAQRVRRAGVSAFGISGTNVHVILEEAPEAPAPQLTAAEPIFSDAPVLLPLSARSEAALRAQAARLADRLDADPALSLPDVAYTLAQRRSHFEQRSALVASGRQDLASQLQALASGAQPIARTRTRGKLVFVFPGHGPQWIAMGKTLLERSPVFSRALERCDAALAPHTGWSVLAVLRGDAGAPELERIDVVQPALFAITVALAGLWRALGVEPDAVVGHSLGEIAAAHVSGALSLEDAAMVVALRARALRPLAGRGGMAAVELPAAELAPRLRARYAGRLEIGAINSGSACAVSGETQALEELLAELEREQVFARKIRIGFASHSAQVEPLREALLQPLSQIRGSASTLPMYSTVLGEPISGEALDAAYFYRNLREPVQLAAAVEHLLGDGYRYFVEVSPHPMLRIPIEDLAQSAGLPAVVVGSLRRDEDGVASMHAALGELYTGGRELDWAKVLPAASGQVVDLPTYAFDRQRYVRDVPPAPRQRSQHGPFVQLHLEASDQPGRHVFEAELDLTDPGYAYLKEHRVLGAAWLPGAALLEMALEAGAVVHADGVQLEDVKFGRAVELSEASSVRLQLIVQAEPDGQGRRAFNIASRPVLEAGSWVANASGFMCAAEPAPLATRAVDELRARCPEAVDTRALYQILAELGFDYGPTFQGIEAAYRGELEALAKLAPRPAAGYVVHPALLDAAFQSVTLPTRFPSGRAYVPAGVSSLRRNAAATPAWVSCSVREIEPDAVVLDFAILDEQERVVMEVRGFREVAEARLPSLVHATQWRTLPAAERGDGKGKSKLPAGAWLIMADRGGVASSLSERLIGARCVTVEASQIDPSSKADFLRLLREAFGAEPPHAIVHAWSLDAGPIDSPSSQAQAERLCCASTLCLTQAIAEMGWSRAPRVVLLTRGAQPARGYADVTHPEQALTWGFGASLAQEHPELSATLIDLDDQETTRDALWSELLHPSDETRIALRGSDRLVPRLVKHALRATEAPTPIRADRAYLVSGGLGGLGLVVAERLSLLGARHLVLLGRRGAGPTVEPALERLRAQGTRVDVVAADVTDRASLTRALAGVAPTIAGVVHAAGVIDDATLLNLAPERLARVLGPKVWGTALLAELLPDVELFVLFSSVAGVLGSAGQAGYAAANAYLDAWALQRRAAGKHALSLAWGPWSEVGMASDHMLRAKNMGASALGAITPAEGAELLALSLTAPQAQLVPVALDNRLLGVLASALPILRELITERRDPAAGAIVAQLSAATSADARRALLEAYLGSVVARVAGADVAPGRDTPLKELGLDSLMLLNLRNVISRELSIELATGKLLSLPTIELLAEHLEGALARGEAKPAEAQTQRDVLRPERWPATRDVMRLLRTEQQGTPNAAHNIGTAVRLRARVQPEKLQAILEGVANRHAALRTAIVADSEHGHALEVRPALDAGLLRRARLQGSLDDREVGARLCALLEEPFALEQAPLFRFELLEDGAGDQVFLLGAHHGVSDARSMLMILGEIDAELSGRELDRGLSNRDLDSLLRAQPLSAAAREDADPIAWRKEFAGTKRLELTLASPRPPAPSYRVASLCLPTHDDLMERVAAEASRLAVTPAAFYLGVLSALIARVSGQSRFAVAVPVDTRAHADAEDAVGFFGVPVPLPAAAHLDEAIDEIVRRTDRQFERVLQKGAAFANALPALVAEGLHRDGAPLIELFFNYINPRLSRFDQLSLLDAGPSYGDVDLMVIVAPQLGHVRLDYHTDILDERACQLLGQSYIDLLGQVTERLARSGAAGTVAELQLSASLERAARAAKPASLPLAASFALGPLSDFVETSFREVGMPVTVAEAPYHQVLASLLDPRGVFAQPQSLAGVILLRAVDLVRYRDDSRERLLDELLEEYADAFAHLSQRASGDMPLLVGFLPVDSRDARFAAWDDKLATRLSKLSGLLVLRADDWTRHYPVDERFAAEADAMSHMPFTPQFLAAMALTLTRTVWGMRRRPLKVVAVDGDNTLWGGVAGELGPDAVDLSGPRAVLARKLLELRAAGVLLVLVSNNDEATVQQVLARPDSLLHAEHFSVISAAWDDKHARLTRAARKLNLGLDSFVFLDDNPVEIAAVRARLPEVMAVTVPEADQLETFLANLWALDVHAVTLEDRKRADYYREELSREALRQELDDFSSFVQKLDLVLDIRPVGPDTLERTLQLSRRTNQFNLRPSALDVQGLRTFADRPNSELWTVSVSDRFGDYGHVGVLALSYDAHTLEVVSFMLSCRVLGRGVEERILHWLADRTEQLERAEVKLIAEHTSRNIPARRLLAALGGGHAENQKLEVKLAPERLRAFRFFERNVESVERTGDADAHGF